MSQASAVPGSIPAREPSRNRATAAFQTLELDTRLLGMILALAAIWIFFNILSGGQFITARNLWNLSVQSAAVAIMATGMVLIIVSRNIDLSIGSVLGLTGMAMAMLQAEWIPRTFGFGFDQPWTWVITLAFGLVLGALVGGVHGFVIAYIGVPSFIVTLGGLLTIRGLIWYQSRGAAVNGLDPTFLLIGGGAQGSIGEGLTWGLAVVGCLAIVALLINGRRQRRRYGFPVRPMWAEIALAVVGCVVVVAVSWFANSNYWPQGLANRVALEQGWGPAPAGGWRIPTGFPLPIVLVIGVTLVMTWIATRRRFGRYVYAYGGNPDAAELAGINTRRTILKTYVLMGILCALAAAIVSARLNGSTLDIGQGYELYVIAAAVVGGTSFAGGIGTIPGAVLGAFVMQSLAYGLSFIGVNSPGQTVVAGLVLIVAVGLDTINRRRGA